MPDDPNHIPKSSRIHLQLGQYPVLGDAMRDGCAMSCSAARDHEGTV